MIFQLGRIKLIEDMKKAFTLIELMVVLGIIAVLVGAMSSSIMKARSRARISKALTEAKELTNAILAYEQYAPDRSLKTAETGGGWKDCDEGSLQMVLGGATGDNGENIPVLFNAATIKGSFLDPWGRPYQYMVEKTGTLAGGGTEKDKETKYVTAPVLPNYFRLSDAERGL